MTILKKIKSLRAEMREIVKTQKSLKTMVEIDMSARYIENKPFEEEFNLNLPLKTLEDKLLFKLFTQTEIVIIDFQLSRVPNLSPQKKRSFST